MTFLKRVIYSIFLVIERPVTENSIILHEDKQYYADAEELYPGVEINVQDEDTQDINVPIIKPLKPKNFSKMEKEIPKTVVTRFL